MFITITRTGGLRAESVWDLALVVLTAVFILFPREKILSQQPPNRRFPRLS